MLIGLVLLLRGLPRATRPQQPNFDLKRRGGAEATLHAREGLADQLRRQHTCNCATSLRGKAPIGANLPAAIQSDDLGAVA